VLYACIGLIDFQLPAGLSGTITVTVQNERGVDSAYLSQ